MSQATGARKCRSMNTCGNGISPARKESTRVRSRDICARAVHESVPHNRRDFAGRSDANSHQRRGRDRDGLRPRSLNEKNLSLGPRRTNSARHGRSKNRRTDREDEASPPIRFRMRHTTTGIKENILRLLRQKGFEVTVVPPAHRLKKCWPSIPTEFFCLTVQVIPRHSLTRTKRYTI
jgi:Carbamoylphosphate synthase small subunit